MPAYGGSLQPPRGWAGRKSTMVAGVAIAALGILACAVVIRGSIGGQEPTELVSAGSSDADLISMQKDVQKQLVEAAKRKAAAKEHRAEALKLSAAAKEDKERAELLKRRSELARREASLQRSEDAVHSSRKKIQSLKDKASELDAGSDKDQSRLDKDKEQIMELEDRAGTLKEKAAEESDKIKVVQEAEKKAAKSLPSLLGTAKEDEKKAADLKSDAAELMANSQKKADAAKRLDQLAEAKEHQAQVVRDKLMGILQEKTKILDSKERDAASEEALAKQDAQKAASDAKSFAAKAAEKAGLAQQATEQAAQASGYEQGAEGEIQMNSLHQETDKKRAVHKAAESKLASVAKVQKPTDHKAIADARAKNLAHAGQEAARRSDSAVDEDENGHLIVKKREVLGPEKHLAEDGHYSSREEAFKRALAAAYRTGYQDEDNAKLSSRGRETQLSQTAHVKPARMQMLGDSAPQGSDGMFSMLSKGPGETVKLEKDSTAATSDKSPMFTQLWYDPSSLQSRTASLQETTHHMRRYAPRDRETNGMPNTELLYEDGHQSRREQKFNSEMGKYKTALMQQRQADLNKAAATEQELEQLPGPGSNSRGFRGDQHRAESTMLAESQNHWDARGRGRYTDMQRQALARQPRRHYDTWHYEHRYAERPRVREDEEGHLVLDDGHQQALDEFPDNRRRASLRGDRMRRLENELADSERRDERLEDRTERLQGEVAELRDEVNGRGARTEDLAELHHWSRRHRMEHRRREVRDGARRRVHERFEAHQRREMGNRGRDERRPAHAAVRGNKKFDPDQTYEKEYAMDPGHVSVGEIKFQHALKDFDRTKAILRQGAMQDEQRFRMPELVPAHLPGQGL